MRFLLSGHRCFLLAEGKWTRPYAEIGGSMNVLVACRARHNVRRPRLFTYFEAAHFLDTFLLLGHLSPFAGYASLSSTDDVSSAYKQIHATAGPLLHAFMRALHAFGPPVVWCSTKASYRSQSPSFEREEQHLFLKISPVALSCRRKSHGGQIPSRGGWDAASYHSARVHSPVYRSVIY